MSNILKQDIMYVNGVGPTKKHHFKGLLICLLMFSVNVLLPLANVAA